MTANFMVKLFREAIRDYHELDLLEPPCPKFHSDDHLSKLFYQKVWVDIIQWHLEDEIRRKDLTPDNFISIKRNIDTLNQTRTEKVEKIDFFLSELLQPEKLNINVFRTESLGWAIDRLSILQLKLFHMEIEAKRTDSTDSLVQKADLGLNKLRNQNLNLIKGIDQLIAELKAGEVKYHYFEQHKLYNDPNTNPALYRVD